MPEEIIRTLSVDGVRYSYRVLPGAHPGEPPATEPTLILGGALQGMFGWPQMDDHLGPATDVVTADLPGMGSADPLPPGPSADLLRRAVLGIADDIGAPRLNIFGFSYGTAIAFGFARRHRERVARSPSAASRSTSTRSRSTPGSGPGCSSRPGTARGSPRRPPTR